MSRALVNRICASFPGAEVSDPWGGGHDCWKVAGKMFALIGTMDDGVTLKAASPETAAMLIEVGHAEANRYLPRGGWIHLPWGRAAEDELAERLRTSYETVRASLPRRVQAALAP
jgi:predicted DNA-binding protein (MmcQ/YjbR family)